MELVVVHLVADQPCVEVVPKPWGVQLDLEDEEGRVLVVVGPVEEVGDQEEGHNLEAVGLEGVVLLEVDQTDLGR